MLLNEGIGFRFYLKIISKLFFKQLFKHSTFNFKNMLISILSDYYEYKTPR